MGSYAQVLLGSFELGSTKDYIDPTIMWLFRPSDKHIRQITNSDQEQLAHYVHEDWLKEYDESNPLTVVKYSCMRDAAIDRLELLGFTLKRAEAEFQKALDSELEDLASHTKHQVPSTLTAHYREKERVWQGMNFDGWYQAFSRIRTQGIDRERLEEIPDDDPQLTLLAHMVNDYRNQYAFPVEEWLLYIRCALETATAQEELEYDLTDLVGGGWVDDSEDLVASAEHLASQDFLLHRRTIVLTEGKSDRRILERSIGLLYPHLADYFHFFDFDAQKSEGGVGQLAKLVSAFAAAGIRERTVALFDNDTAATEALRGVDVASLPKNIAVRRLPNLDLAERYPALGPSGVDRMDVNGLAGSIELYLGEEVLAPDDGGFVAIRWTGFSDSVKEYQGSFSKADKGRIQRRFEEKIADCEADPKRISMYQWEGLHAIIGVLRTAFQDVDWHEDQEDA